MTKKMLSTIVFVLAGITSCLTLSAQSVAPRQPIARVGEQPIYEEDLHPVIAAQLLQLKNQEYELKSKALENVVNQRLLENEAKRKGLSVDALWEQTVDRNLAPPSGAEVQAYYLGQKDRLNRPFAEVKPQLEQALIQAKRQQAHQDYLDQLRRQAGVAILLDHPRMEVAADPQRLRGNAHAPVTIIEFSDFQCPYCRAAEPILKQVMDQYGEKVQLGFRDFPLRQIHQQAQQAAEASRCAADQGKFWEYHDLLYANQSRLDQAGLTDQARASGLDMPQFSTCLASGKFKPMIESDLQAGASSGVSGTPAFYINGIFLSGAQPVSEFQKIIDSELANGERTSGESRRFACPNGSCGHAGLHIDQAHTPH